MINEVFSEIASFEIIPSDKINELLYFFPEEEPFNLSFQECGVESQLFLVNMGFPLYIILGHMALIFLNLLLYLTNLLLKLKCLGKITNYLSGYLFWNGLIRLFMEVYLGMALAAVLNTIVADWQSPFKWVKVSNYAGLVSLILAISLPILVFLPFYCRRRAQWSK